MAIVINIAAYKFIELSDLSEWQNQFRTQCEQHQLLGTVLLSSEGINFMLAGETPAINRWISCLKQYPEFSDVTINKSESTFTPFKRLKVVIKPEIITYRQPQIDPHKCAVPYIMPTDLKQWLDEERDVALLDTRNNYEIAHGTFDGALHLDIKRFTEFNKALESLDDELKSKPLVTVCTGGVRCEKAGIRLHEAGFKHVYQLRGGILNYFKECGHAHYHQHCFVFDERIALTPDLRAIGERAL